jgi:hypothetical protein
MGGNSGSHAYGIVFVCYILFPFLFFPFLFLLFFFFLVVSLSVQMGILLLISQINNNVLLL